MPEYFATRLICVKAVDASAFRASNIDLVLINNTSPMVSAGTPAASPVHAGTASEGNHSSTITLRTLIGFSTSASPIQNNLQATISEL